MLKKFFKVMTSKFIKNKYEPDIIKNQDGFIIKNYDYKVNVLIENEFIYFNFEKYYFCIKIDKKNLNSKTEILKEIIQRTYIFNLKKEYFRDFLNIHACDNNPSYYIIFFQGKKNNIEYKNKIYHLLEIECNNFIKDVKKIKVKIVNKDGTYKQKRGYLTENKFFYVSNLNDYLFRLKINNEINENFSGLCLKKTFKNYEILKKYTKIEAVDNLINSVSQEVDLSKISVLECFDKFIFLTEFEGKKNIVCFMKNEKKNNGKNYYSLVIENGKIKNNKKIYNEKDIENFQLSIFNKIHNNFNLIKKYYSKELIYKLSEYNLITDEKFIDKEIISLYRILKI